jgi:acetyltransferase-like isoleucine patch superfamily enzyme
MNNFSESLRTRGAVETIFLSGWLISLRVISWLRVAIYKLRGYNLPFSTLFYGSVWLQRSTKNSIHIGKNCNFGGEVKVRCYGTGKVLIKNNCSIGEYSIIHAGSSVTIGNNVVTGAFCYINDTNHDFTDITVPIINQGWKAKPIKIEDNVWIGANVTILDGICIGRDSVIGAGSVVTKDVEPFTVVAGVPAKKLYSRTS